MTSPKDVKPREWWIHSTGNAYTKDVSSNFPVDHVVEISALRDAERERDEAIRKYASIELANPELTRNDHATFGDLILKNKKQSEIITELESALNDMDFYTCSACKDNQQIREYTLFKLAKHRGEP